MGKCSPGSSVSEPQSNTFFSILIIYYRWVYTLILSQDANFHLKGRLRASDAKDPTLGPGWAYFVANDAYLKHLSKYVDQDEVRFFYFIKLRFF